MTELIWICLIGFFALFGIKMLYVASAAMALPETRGALYVSTSRKRIQAAMACMPKNALNRIVDLGCGDGRVLRHACRSSNAVCIGYEINLFAYAKARLLCMTWKNIRIRRRSFWHADLSDADAVFCYLFPDVMADLARKLKTELKPGAAIVSFNFPLPGFSPETVLRPTGSMHGDPIFIYTQP